MIVAHPDDESLFGGAQLLMGGWKVVCVTNGNNQVRRSEFESVMRITNSEFEIWNYSDSFCGLDGPSLVTDISRVIDECGWEKILTHNEQGEYRHKHHLQIHKIVKSFNENASFFSFDEPLPEEIWQRKLGLIEQYKSQSHVCKDFIFMARAESLR
jgi:LmbE family N-acetylglucosaminyl deacetylase